MLLFGVVSVSGFVTKEDRYYLRSLLSGIVTIGSRYYGRSLLLEVVTIRGRYYRRSLLSEVVTIGGCYASVNSSSAHPPGLTPGHKHFFLKSGQIPRGGDTLAVLMPRGWDEE